MVALGTLVALVAGIVAVVFFFQPWRSCDYEDTSVGCAMLPADATIMGIAGFLSVIGVVVLIVGIVGKEAVPD